MKLKIQIAKIIIVHKLLEGLKKLRIFFYYYYIAAYEIKNTNSYNNHSAQAVINLGKKLRFFSLTVQPMKLKIKITKIIIMHKLLEVLKEN